LARDSSQHRPDRRVRKFALGKAEAVPGEHVRATFLGDARELPEEPALADPGVAGQEDRRELAHSCALEGFQERGELLPTADELGARNAARHRRIIPPSRPQTAARRPLSGDAI
jgi:hypothetical protein